MALVKGFERDANGALVTSSAAPDGTATRHLGWARSTSNAAHRSNATVALPAGAVVSRGRAFSSAGAVCFTTSAPTGDSAKYIHGILHHVNGAMLAKSSAPTSTARRSGLEGLLYDPADGACFFDSVA